MAHRSRSRSEDDIDILLDQVEEQYIKPKNSVSRFQTPAKQKAASRTSTRNSKCECTTKAPTDWAEVEELLQDFRFEDANPFGKQNNKSWVRQPLLDHNEPTISVKCSPVYLAGSHEVLGYSVTGNEKPCDSLKCIKCDFDVIALDNFTWDPSTDYLFLRNNMPDFDKLRSRLSKTNGYRAYACQCRHVNISKLTNINSQPQLQWVCKSHNVRANEQKPGSSSSESRSFVF